MATNPSYPDQIQPTDSPEMASQKTERLIARNSTIKIKDVSDQSSFEIQTALAFARNICLFTNASGGDIAESFPQIRVAFNDAAGQSDKPMWALTSERTVATEIRTEEFYASPTIYNSDATIGQLYAFAKPIHEAVRGKLH